MEPVRDLLRRTPGLPAEPTTRRVFQLLDVDTVIDGHAWPKETEDQKVSDRLNAKKKLEVEALDAETREPAWCQHPGRHSEAGGQQGRHRPCWKDLRARPDAPDRRSGSSRLASNVPRTSAGWDGRRGGTRSFRCARSSSGADQRSARRLRDDLDTPEHRGSPGLSAAGSTAASKTPRSTSRSRGARSWIG